MPPERPYISTRLIEMALCRLRIGHPHSANLQGFGGEGTRPVLRRLSGPRRVSQSGGLSRGFFNPLPGWDGPVPPRIRTGFEFVPP